MKRSLYANSKRLTTVFAICLFVLIAVLLGLRLTLLSNMASAPAAAANTFTSRYLTYSLNQEVYFSSTTAEGNVLISSAPENKNYMTVTITLSTAKNPLLYTGFIGPGESLKKSALDNAQELDLPDGVYDCVATIKAYDPATRDLLGSEEQDVVLYIGKQSTE